MTWDFFEVSFWSNGVRLVVVVVVVVYSYTVKCNASMLWKSGAIKERNRRRIQGKRNVFSPPSLFLTQAGWIVSLHWKLWWLVDFGNIDRNTLDFSSSFFFFSRASTGPFSSTHVSRWNYSNPSTYLRMRYDVYEHNTITNAFTESNNLFVFDQKMMYRWDSRNTSSCMKCPHNTIEYECIPNGWMVEDVMWIAGQVWRVFLFLLCLSHNSLFL